MGRFAAVPKAFGVLITVDLERIAACKSLEELRSLCLKDDGLCTDLEDTQLVFGVGNPKARLMLIGEAPGREEDEKGEPFVGRSGRLLTQLIETHLGFKREEVYIANIVKHRPPENRDPKPAERKYGLAYLNRQIQLVAPDIILCVGRISAQTLLGKNYALKAMRQQWFPYEKAYLTATYHPAALLRNPNWKPSFEEDMAFIAKKLKHRN